MQCCACGKRMSIELFSSKGLKASHFIELCARNNHIYFAFMENISLPSSLMKIEPQVKQYQELLGLREKLSSAMRVPSSEETSAHMAVRLAAERELRGRMEYLEELISLAVVNTFKELCRI